ncbi:MAG: bifunctional lysine ketoglutarate reductase /saccharopine dehydrogenase family protein [bacterium]
MKSSIIGIRREDKNIWERRAPLTPEQIGALISEHEIRCLVQSSSIRVFSDEEYRRVGAEVSDDIAGCPLVLGIKEMPSNFFRPQGTYMFFAHVIKGQHRNMGMLKRLIELGCSLIDYERITDDDGKRLVFFGWFAGVAGMIDTLAGLGKRLLTLGWNTPLNEIRLAHEYGSFDVARNEISRIGARIRHQGLPKELTPFVIGVTGYGNVARGAGEVLTALGTTKVSSSDLPLLLKEGKPELIYQVVFREEDMVEPKNPKKSFDLKEYFTHPEFYRSKFERFLPYLSVLVNCIYWDPRYPRLVTKDYLRANFVPDKFKLIIIGDISCDIEGSVEITVKTTTPGAPFFVYNPLTEKVEDGLEGRGITVMAVDNLPCELAADSSREFGRALMPFIPSLARCDFGVDIKQLTLPAPLRRALIVYQGRLTPLYEYLEQFIRERS